MKCKIFGTKTNELPDLESQVNDWLGKRKLRIHHTNLVVNNSKDVHSCFYTLIVFYEG